MHKPAITDTPIHEVLASRWSPRAFDGSKPVSQTQILSLLEAARWAPSCYGDQPWRFVVCDKTTNPDAWQRAYDAIMPGNQTWAVNAPVLILVCANTLFSHNQKPNRWGGYDTGAAAENLCLQAASLGLATHQMGGFDGDKARELLGVPAQFEMMSMLSVGYQADTDSLSGEMKERELASRNRNALGELFFDGVWDKPII